MRKGKGAANNGMKRIGENDARLPLMPSVRA
jgi:hypothetical protein